MFRAEILKNAKRKKMKNRSMQMAAGCSVALLILFAATQVLVSGQENASVDSFGDRAPQSRSIEGVWRTTVTVRNCQTGAAIATFRGLSTYNQGGTMSENAASSNPALRSASHGIWKQEVRGTYSVSFVFLRFNPDGTFAGTQRTTAINEITGEGNTYDSTASIEVRDPNDNLLFTGCATATAIRFD
jgi:hypothetical protein